MEREKKKELNYKVLQGFPWGGGENKNFKSTKTLLNVIMGTRNPQGPQHQCLVKTANNQM
jgi:hypothetical protein